jgi:hypothetical protein
MKRHTTNRFHPTVESLDSREMLAAFSLTGLSLPTTIRALAPSSLRGRDITNLVRNKLQKYIAGQLPRDLGSFSGVSVQLDGVSVDKIVVDPQGKIDGKVTLTFGYKLIFSGSADIFVLINNNKVRLDTDSALVRQFVDLNGLRQQYGPIVQSYINKYLSGQPLDKLLAHR